MRILGLIISLVQHTQKLKFMVSLDEYDYALFQATTVNKLNIS